MYEENIIENGIVLKTDNGLAEIELLESGSCEECTAKIFCKPSGSKDAKILEVSDPIGVKKGDRVQIEIAGGAVLKASAIMYGLPLVLIVAGIMIGMSIFKSSPSPELFSFILGIGLIVLYFGSLFLIKGIKTFKPNLPKIISVNH